MARQTFTREFKLQAVQMLTDQKLSVAEVARKLGVSENNLRNWKKAAQAPGVDAFPGHGNVSSADDELRRLRAEVARLKAERDLLKKAAAYFARNSGLSKSSSMAETISRGFRGWMSMPFFISSTISGTPPTAEAITGISAMPASRAA